jgi:hypothetical protein
MSGYNQQLDEAIESRSDTEAVVSIPDTMDLSIGI